MTYSAARIKRWVLITAMAAKYLSGVQPSKRDFLTLANKFTSSSLFRMSVKVNPIYPIAVIMGAVKAATSSVETISSFASKPIPAAVPDTPYVMMSLSLSKFALLTASPSPRFTAVLSSLARGTGSRTMSCIADWRDDILSSNTVLSI